MKGREHSNMRLVAERHPGFGTGTKLWLLRHAEVAAEWRGRFYGDLDVPLSDEGLRVTEELARAFGDAGVDAVLSSPLERALELGRAVARASGAELEVVPDLRELSRGVWQGRHPEEIADEMAPYYADPWSFDGHAGESDATLAARVWPVVERAIESRPGGTVVLATHYNVIRVIAGIALGIASPRTFALRVDPGRAVLFEDTRRGFVLRCSNVAVSMSGGTGTAAEEVGA
ncbi:MAG: histidine phosphatase family protein [Planctomycetota bacterium]|nr:histidine phosphatase family protein [Planctomycetota bacterium]